MLTTKYCLAISIVFSALFSFHIHIRLLFTRNTCTYAQFTSLIYRIRNPSGSNESRLDPSPSPVCQSGGAAAPLRFVFSTCSCSPSHYNPRFILIISSLLAVPNIFLDGQSTTWFEQTCSRRFQSYKSSVTHLNFNFGVQASFPISCPVLVTD